TCEITFETRNRWQISARPTTQSQLDRLSRSQGNMNDDQRFVHVPRKTSTALRIERSRNSDCTSVPTHQTEHWIRERYARGFERPPGFSTRPQALHGPRNPACGIASDE